MKATLVLLCLGVLASTCCLLSSTSANALNSGEIDETEIELLLAELESLEDYVDIEAFGFIKSCCKILKKALKSVRGTNCIIKEVLAVMQACTDYVDAVDACGGAVPKDVAKIVASCKSMIAICNDIIHLKSTLCASDDSSSNAKTSRKCFLKVFKATMSLVRRMNETLKLIAKLPADTSSCFLDATDEVKNAFNSFLPNIDVCVDSM